MEGIQLSVEQSGPQNNISIIKVGGYIDTTTSSELDHHLNELVKKGSYNIIVDLANVDYVSSAGWGIFISEIKGIREHNGDLKLARMIPEVYEVFELLEFHYILKAFDTLEDAIRDFERNGTAPAPSTPPTVSERQPSEETQQGKETQSERRESGTAAEATTQFRRNTLEDNIRKIITEFPDAGTIQIAKMLNSPKYNNTKIGWFKLRRYLKDLNLDTKEKRRDLARKTTT